MKKLLLPGLLLMALSSCYNDKQEDLYPAGGCNTDTVTYSRTIQPILNQNCALSGCHDAASAMSGVVLDNYNGAKAKQDRLVGVINHETGYSPMPKGLPKLDDCTIAKITKWVAGGAPNN